jgi:hypothetical protein
LSAIEAAVTRADAAICKLERLRVLALECGFEAIAAESRPRHRVHHRRRRLRRAVREPRRLDIHIHIHGSPGGPGERESVFFEYPDNPSGNIIAFPRRDMVRTRRAASRGTIHNALI